MRRSTFRNDVNDGLVTQSADSEANHLPNRCNQAVGPVHHTGYQTLGETPPQIRKRVLVDQWVVLIVCWVHGYESRFRILVYKSNIG